MCRKVSCPVSMFSHVFVLLCALVASNIQVATAYCNGDATYYGGGQDNKGTCSFWAGGADSMPWAQGNAGLNTGIFSGESVRLALNAPQFDGSFACGTCLRFRSRGTGLGNSNDKPPSDWTYAIINNKCPECKPCDVDIPRSRDGRWQVEWEQIECPVGDTGLQYHHVGSHPFYLKLAVFNHRVPLKQVEVNVNGEWRTGAKTEDNYWIIPGSGFTNKMDVRVTSVNGDVVEDTITPSLKDDNWVGAGLNGRQFPGQGAAPAPAPEPTVEAISSPRINARVAAPVTRMSRTPSSSTPSSGPSKKKKCFPLNKGWQCGGTGGFCNSGTGCVDQPWKGGCCKKSKCKRSTAEQWFCN